MIKVNNKVNIQKGFTLVEIIVSMAILAIISVALLTMFLFGFKSIVSSGINSKNQYNARSILESNISDKANTSSSLTRTGSVTIVLRNAMGSYTVTGETIVVTYPYSNSTNKITTFIGY